MNIKAFMKEELKNREEQTMEFPGVDTFKDKDGKPIPFIIKKLSRKKIDDIREFYTKDEVFRDKQNRGRVLVENGHVVTRERYDSGKASKEMMVEAFVQPKLDDKELMDYYGVVDRLDMVDIMFANNKDFQYANDCLMIALGFKEQESEEKIIDEVKNS